MQVQKIVRLVNSKDLKLSTRMVLISLATYPKDFYPSVSQLSQENKLDRGTVGLALKELVELGMIKSVGKYFSGHGSSVTKYEVSESTIEESEVYWNAIFEGKLDSTPKTNKNTLSEAFVEKYLSNPTLEDYELECDIKAFRDELAKLTVSAKDNTLPVTSKKVKPSFRRPVQTISIRKPKTKLNHSNLGDVKPDSSGINLNEFRAALKLSKKNNNLSKFA